MDDDDGARADLIQYIEMMLTARSDLDDAQRSNYRTRMGTAAVAELHALATEVTTSTSKATGDDPTELAHGRWRGD